MAVVLGSLALAASPGRARPAANALVDAIRWFEEPNQAQALIDLESGTMDMYMFPLRTASDINAARANPSLSLLDTVGSLFNLFVDPVPTNETLVPGKMNPFALRPVREALNYLLDRDNISMAFYAGVARTHIGPWPPETPEYGREAGFFTELTHRYAHDPQRAWDLVYGAMTGAGATFEGGVWMYKGSPVDLHFVIRVEDIRLDIGNYIADLIEAVLGFQVVREYKSGGAAFAIVYNGPPDVNAWHLYTEGWAFSWGVAWPDSDLDFFHNGGDGTAVWSFYRPPPELSSVATSLRDRAYGSLDERRALVERGTVLAVNESVRVWLVADAVGVYSKRVTAFAYDLTSGPWSPFAVRTARFASPGGTLQIGQRIQFLSTYQPWRGFGWQYDRLVFQSMSDPGLGIHPHNASSIPVRSNFAVTTAGPSGNLTVPSDAVFYNASFDVWATVPPGQTAVSKVVFDYTFGPWHHGVDMSMDDVLYEIALLVRRDRGDIAAIDSDAASAEARAFAAAFKGLRVADADTLEVYLDRWHIDPAVIAADASVFPATPWEVGELGMATVLADETRVSEISAAIAGKEPLDLAKGASLGFLDGHLPTLAAANHRPPGADSYPGGGITSSEATARWTALASWRAATGNFFASNGPYSLCSVDEASHVVVLAAFAGYPFPADHWDRLLTPRVPAVALGPVGDVPVGSAASFNATTTLDSQPYDNATVEHLVWNNATGDVVLRGRAVRTGPGQWRIDLSAQDTGLLTPGAVYTLEVVAVGAEAVIPVTDRANFRARTTADGTPPVSSVAAVAACYNADEVPFLVTATASDDLSGVASVDLLYAFSADGATWTAPASLGARTGPFEWTFDPGALQGDGTYRLWSLATDGRGNQEVLASKNPAGDVAFPVDTVAPKVRTTSPTYGASVPVDAPITVRFSERIDAGQPFAVSLTPPAGTLTYAWDASGTTVTVGHAPFAEGATYTASVPQGVDLCGNPVEAFSWTWTTKVTDTVAPMSTVAPPGAYWYRSGPIPIVATATDAKSGVARMDLYVSWSADNATWSTPALAATLSAPPFALGYTPALATGHVRFWTIATDRAGNAEPWSAKPAGGQAQVGFDTVAPTVSLVVPSPGATSVPATTTEIRVRFSEPVDHASAEAAFSIAPATAGTFTWEGDTLVFHPSSVLVAGAEYTVRISTGVRDRAGNALPSEFVSTFRTSAPSFVESAALPLVLVAVVVAAAAVGIALWGQRGKRSP